MFLATSEVKYLVSKVSHGAVLGNFLDIAHCSFTANAASFANAVGFGGDSQYPVSQLNSSTVMVCGLCFALQSRCWKTLLRCLQNTTFVDNNGTLFDGIRIPSDRAGAVAVLSPASVDFVVRTFLLVLRHFCAVMMFPAVLR